MEEGGAEILWVEFSAATLWVPLLFLLVFLEGSWRKGGKEERVGGMGSERWIEEEGKGEERREEEN